MRSELGTFVTYLTNQHILDDAGAILRIGDNLKAPKKTAAGLEWGYRSGRVVLRLAPGGVTWPEKSTSLVCSLDFEVKGTVTVGQNPRTATFDWDIVRSQMQIEFAAESSTRGSGWSQFWHLDTHYDEAGKPVPDEAHPRFHLHYGGHAMKARREHEADCWGRSLELSGPRFAHPPMDLVLALDFIFANATGPRWKQEFRKAKDYTAAVCRAQRRFWRPHQNTLSSFYDCDRLKQESHPALSLLPTLLVNQL